MLFTFEATDDQKKQPKLKKKERERERETRQCGEGKQWRQQAFLLPSFMAMAVCLGGLHAMHQARKLQHI
jgi:hypothetical protein